MFRTESDAPLLMNAPSLQPQAFGELLEQARQLSGQLTGPIHSLEIEAEPGQEAEPNRSWDSQPSSSRQSHSWGGAGYSKQVDIPNHNDCLPHGAYRRHHWVPGPAMYRSGDDCL